MSRMKRRKPKRAKLTPHAQLLLPGSPPPGNVSASFIAEVEEAGPQEEDLQTEDYSEFYSNGKLALTVSPDASSARMWEALEAYMAKENFWPNVWWISDHGNAHLMVRNSENEPLVRAGRMTALEKKVMAHPAVADAHIENDGCFWTADGTPIPGIWVDLKPGWRHEDCISIHAPSWKEALAQLKSAKKTLEEPVKAGRTKKKKAGFYWQSPLSQSADENGHRWAHRLGAVVSGISEAGELSGVADALKMLLVVAEDPSRREDRHGDNGSLQIQMVFGGEFGKDVGEHISVTGTSKDWVGEFSFEIPIHGVKQLRALREALPRDDGTGAEALLRGAFDTAGEATNRMRRKSMHGWKDFLHSILERRALDYDI
jgi:hypothetical protein